MINFSVTDWFYWGDVYYAADAPTADKEKKPQLDNIPAIQRRRLPEVAKRINQFALAAKEKNTPIIYVSCHGTLEQTLAIIRSFAEDVSPMRFSLSVHNAIAGLLSVAHRNTQSYQAIDSLSGPIEMGFIEAFSYLAQHRSAAVIYYEEPLPEPLSHLTPQEQVFDTRVFGATITAGNDYQLQKNAAPKSADQGGYSDYSPQLIADFFNAPEVKTLQTRTSYARWTWQRNDS